MKDHLNKNVVSFNENASFCAAAAVDVWQTFIKCKSTTEFTWNLQMHLIKKLDVEIDTLK